MAMEKPRFVFAFGPTPGSYFVGCGEEMDWNKLPTELESILTNRASSVISISLGCEQAFYCRYVSRHNGEEYTISGNLPPNLSFLLSCWHANPNELPHISLGPSPGSFFFQSSALAAWENLPGRLDTLLNELRDGDHGEIPARALALGADGSFVFLTGEDEQFPVWDNIDGELAHRLSGDEEKVVVDSATLSLACKEDYLVVFFDGSIFYSVPDSLLPIVQRFVQMYHIALAEYELLQRPPSPREEMRATLAAKTGGFSLELPDGILGWDEQLITRFIERAMMMGGSASASTASSTPPPPAYGRPAPYSRPGSRATSGKRGIGGGGLRKLGTGSWRGTDYAASWVESQLALGSVIEL